MDNIALKRLARDKLYEDRELGCGNFLFKARELSPTTATPFLFLERPFTTPFGETFAEFSFDTLYAVVKSLAQWYISQGIIERDIVCTFLEDGIAHFIHCLALNSINATVAIIAREPPQFRKRLFSRTTSTLSESVNVLGNSSKTLRIAWLRACRPHIPPASAI